jgi:nucleolar protein 4
MRATNFLSDFELFFLRPSRQTKRGQFFSPPTMSKTTKRQKLDNATPSATAGVEDPEELNHSKKTPATSSTGAPNSKDPRTIFVRQLAPAVTNDDLTTLFSQSYPIKHAVAVLDPTTKACKGYGFVTFTDAADAARAIAELNNTELKGRKIKVEQAQVRTRADEDGQKKVLNKPDRLPPPKLIVRNLPWSVNTPEKLRKLFLAYGKVMEAILPKNSEGKMLGFGIVMIRGRPNNEKALEGMNGKEVDGRTIAVDWAADKETWAKVKQAELEKEKAENGVKPKKEKKVKVAETNGDTVSDDEDIDDTVDKVLAEKLQEHLDDSENESDEDLSDEDEDEDDLLETDEEDEDEDESPAPKKLMKNNDTTIFVRNLPFSVIDEDLGEHFEQFGPIRYSRVVFDNETEQSKGCGFVCFVQKEDADTCVREAPRTTTSNDFDHPKKKGPGGQTVLQDEASDPSGNYTMDGRVIIVSKAVNKDEASKLKDDGIERRNLRDKDKRKLYLLNEGKITPKSPLFKKLAPSDIAMRDTSAKQRKKLVETNPSLHLSLTRLSVRNIPRSLESKDLKALARQAVVGFASEVKKDEREKLSKEELAREAEGMKEAERIRKIRGKGIVRQAKVVFESKEGSKVQELDGAGRSRGYGFIEYYTHRNALMGLRWLNGHQISYQTISKSKGDKMTAEDKNRRLIVEFALENVNVVNRRKDRETKTFNRSKGDPIETDGYDAATDKTNGKERGRDGKKGKQHKEAKGSEKSASKPAAGNRKGAGPASRTEDGRVQTSKKEQEDEKLAKRTRIIVRKRMARKSRKQGG